MSIQVIVQRLPPCSFNAQHGNAHYDGSTRMGYWAYMCRTCFRLYGNGLGTGIGQELILQTPKGGVVLELKLRELVHEELISQRGQGTPIPTEDSEMLSLAEGWMWGEDSEFARVVQLTVAEWMANELATQINA